MTRTKAILTTRIDTRTLPAKEGAHSKNCAKKKECGTKSEGETDMGKRKETSLVSPFKIPPKDTEPKTKKIGDVNAS